MFSATITTPAPQHQPSERHQQGYERLLVPELLSPKPRSCSVPASELVMYTAAKQMRQLRVLPPRTRVHALNRMAVVVDVDGACRDNGKLTARASWGVYVGPGSRYNVAGCLDPGLAQTNSRAEIEALSRALAVIKDFTRGDYSLHDIKIRCDSQYLCLAMARWMEGWIKRGGLQSSGGPVAHFDKLKEIHATIDDMINGDDGGLHLELCHVPREQNRDADRLANQALDK